jgi:hypothetical protein
MFSLFEPGQSRVEDTNLEAGAGTIMDRRAFLVGAAAALAPAGEAWAATAPDLKTIQAEIEKRHDESVRRIQDWMRQPTIAAENKGIQEGCDLMMQLLRDAGCDQVLCAPRRF